MENDDELTRDSVVEFVRSLRDPAQRDRAASEIWQRTYEHLKRRMAGLIAQRLQGKVSEESALQEAFRSFFSGAGRGEFEIRDEGGLIALLAKLAHNKLMSRIRFESGAQKRSPSAGADDDDAGEGHLVTGGDNAPGLEAGQLPAEPEPLRRFYACREPVDPRARGEQNPDPDAAVAEFLQECDAVTLAVYMEKVETLSPDLKECLRLKGEGFSDGEIAEKMQISPEAVRWKVEEVLRAEFQELRDDTDFGADARKQRKRRAP